MSLTQVPIELKKRGVFVTCAAWTPWCMADGAEIAEYAGKSPHIGVDSCGIFMVDQDHNMKVSVQWGPGSIHPITGAAVPAQSAVAGDNADTAFRRELHQYHRHNAPGQHWSCFKIWLPGDGANFERSLRDLLDPATTPEELELIEKPVGMMGCGYLRVRQKVLDPNEWLVQGKPHNGAHFPLCIFTQNESHRSDDARQRRDAQRKARAPQRGDHKGWRGASRRYSDSPPPFSVLSSVVPPPTVQQTIGSEASGSQDVPQSRQQPFILLDPQLASLADWRSGGN